KFMTAPGLGPITALCFKCPSENTKATIRTASSDREVLAPMSDQDQGALQSGRFRSTNGATRVSKPSRCRRSKAHPFITVWLEVRVLPGPVCTEDWIRLDARQRLGNPAT